MPAFVQTAKDERRWAKAKRIVAEEYGLSEETPRFWRLATTIFKRMRKSVARPSLAFLSKRYNPAEARVPAGRSEGGQWTRGSYTAKVQTPASVQYRYPKEWTQMRATEKFDRAAHLAHSIGHIRAAAGKLLNEPLGSRARAVGAIMELIDRYCLRVGSAESREAHEHFGATTLERRHVRPQHDRSVILDFPGKAGVAWSVHVPAGRAAATIISLYRKTKQPKDPIFRYKSAETWKLISPSAVNSFLEPWGISAKDFRTYHACRLTYKHLRDIIQQEHGDKEIPALKSARKKLIARAIEQTAAILNHEPSVCRSRYVAPEIYERFEKHAVLPQRSRFGKSFVLEGEEEFRAWIIREAHRRSRPARDKGIFSAVEKSYRRGHKRRLASGAVVWVTGHNTKQQASPGKKEYAGFAEWKRKFTEATPQPTDRLRRILDRVTWHGQAGGHYAIAENVTDAQIGVLWRALGLAGTPRRQRAYPQRADERNLYEFVLRNGRTDLWIHRTDLRHVHEILVAQHPEAMARMHAVAKSTRGPQAKARILPESVTAALAKRLLKEFNVEVSEQDFGLAEFEAGLRVETEHAEGPLPAVRDWASVGRIALAHLRERADYYKQLDKAENAPIAKSAKPDTAVAADDIYNRVLTRREVRNAIARRLDKPPDGPDVAPKGKAYHIVWAEGRAAVSFRKRRNARRFAAQKLIEDDLCSFRYGDNPKRKNGKAWTYHDEEIERLWANGGPLEKSHVKGHYRTVNGKQVWVREHEDKRTKTTPEARPSPDVRVEPTMGTHTPTISFEDYTRLMRGKGAKFSRKYLRGSYRQMVEAGKIKEPSYLMAQRGEEDARQLGYHPESQILAMMSPAAFLGKTWAGRGNFETSSLVSKKKVAALTERIGSGKVMDAPFLDLDVRTGETTGHEGRHRALAAKRLGIKQIPVIIYLRDGSKYAKVADHPAIVADYSPQITKALQWWADAKVGDERWITVHTGEDDEGYRHVKVKLRPGGKWRIVAGGTHLEHQEIVPRHELTPEEREAYDRHRAAREAARKEHAKALEKVGEVRKQHRGEIARALGLSTELKPEQKQEIERKAQALKLQGKERERFVEKQTQASQEAHEKWVADAVGRLVQQSRSVVFAADPNAEFKQITRAHEEAEAQKRELARRMLEARLAQASEKPGAQPPPEPERESAKPAKEEPIYTAEAVPIIASVETAQKIAVLARESEKMVREARKELPKLSEDRLAGTEALEEFSISAEAADAPEAERELMADREARLREQLNSSLVSIADATYRADPTAGEGSYDRFGKRRYDVARAQATGALDAITGISKHFLGSSFMDRPIVEVLGIDGAAALAAGEILRQRGREGAGKILAEIEDYQHDAAATVAETALQRHRSLMEAKATLEKAASAPLVDKDGNLQANALAETADATALYGELCADALRHVGTALGSLQASASLIRLLQEGVRGKRMDVVRIALRDSEDAKLIDKALRLRGRYRTEDVEGGGYAMVISPKALSRYLKQAKNEEEADVRAKAIQDGTARVDLDAIPAGWRRTYTDESGQKRRFAWKEGQARALAFALERSKPAGGGAVIDLEVGGGKTAFAAGYLGSLKERGWIGEGKRGLYVAPKDSLASQVIGDIGKFTEYSTARIGGGARGTEEEIKGRYTGDGFIGVVTAQTLAADVKALENMGIDPSAFFKGLGFDGMVIDEAHLMMAGLSGSSKTGSAIRKLHLPFSVAMTGTLATNAISQPFDMVRWAVGNKVDSRAKVLRKYGEVGLGTEAWQQAVNEDVRSQIDRYVFHGSGNIEAKLNSSERRVLIGHEQRSELREVDGADRARRKEALRAARRQGRAGVDMGTKLRLEADRRRDVYEVLHDRNWRTNPRLVEIGKAIEQASRENPNTKFIVIGDTSDSIAGVHAVVRMLSDMGLGDNTALFASRTLDGKPISQQQMTRAQARFASDPKCRFAVLAEPQAVGRNMQSADVVIHLDVPPNTSSRKQRRGRAWRTGRMGDVNEIQFWTDQHPFDVGRRLNMERTAGMLEAASGV